MLRITIQESREAVTVILEGRLVGPWIREVERAWGGVAGQSGGRPLVVDLSGVTFVAEEGKHLLGRILDQGGELLAADVRARAVVEELHRCKSPATGV